MEHPGIQEVRERLITAAQTADPSLLAQMLAGQSTPSMGGNRHPADIMIQALSGGSPEIPGQLATLMARLCAQKADELEQYLAKIFPNPGGFVADDLPDEAFLFNLFLFASFLPRTGSLFLALARYYEKPGLNPFASGMGRSPRQLNEALVRQQTDDRFAPRWLSQLTIPHEKGHPLSDDPLNALLEAWRALLWIPTAEAQCKKGETIDFDRVERGLLCIADTMQGRPEEQEVLDLVLGRLDSMYGRSAEFWQKRLAPLLTHCPDPLTQAIHAYWPTPLIEDETPLRFPDEQTQADWTSLPKKQTLFQRPAIFPQPYQKGQRSTMSVFLTHNHNDKDFVRRIGSRLKKKGFSVWIDEAEIKPGDFIDEKINIGINNCEYILAFLSKHSIHSEWVKKELSIANTLNESGKRIIIIPIRLDAIEIPEYLPNNILCVDFSIEKDFNINFDRLLSAIGADRYTEVTEENLELLDYHAAIVDSSKIVALGSSLSVKDDHIFRDPDGESYPLKDLYLVRASEKTFKVIRFSSIRLAHSCIIETEKYYVTFANFKPRQGTYEMCGYKWFIEKSSMTVKRVEKTFENKNWGWFPIIDASLDVIHFSFDGYRRYKNSIDQGYVEPSSIEKEHVNFVSNTSSEHIPNSSHHIAMVIRSYL
ncbi:MAG: toll/interleukin-1 receptor domain-containing protein [Magnetococcales bacterium]|nr:toll/interleukin-1 receptor domain-containing protein [Magnetococcales bacterium]